MRRPACLCAAILVCVGAAMGAARAPGLAQRLASPWPCARGGPGNAALGLGPAAAGVRRWEFKAGGPVHAAPVVAGDGTVYVAARDGKVYALDGATGEKRWEFAAWAPLSHSPAVGPTGLVYVASAEGRLYALDPATGRRRWAYRIRNAAASPEAVPENLPPGALTGRQSYTFRLDNTAATAEEAWASIPARPGPTHLSRPPVVGADGTVWVPGSDGYLYGLDGATGDRRAEAREYRGLAPALGDRGRTVFALACADPRNGLHRLSLLCAFDARSGRLRWSFYPLLHVHGCRTPSDGVVATPEGTVLIAAPLMPEPGPQPPREAGAPPEAPACTLVALDGRTGRMRWRFVAERAGRLGAPAVGPDGTLYAAASGRPPDVDPVLYAVDGASGEERWRRTLTDQAGDQVAVTADGAVYVAAGKTLRALDGRSGRDLWSFQAADTVGPPAIGADGTVYFGCGDGTVYAVR